MRKLVYRKLRRHEDKSNHAMLAFTYDDCPINKVCFYMATGFGGVLAKGCASFTESKNKEHIFCARLSKKG